MGVERNAFLGRGVILTRPAQEKTRVPNCNHPEREGNKLCPTCGKEVYTRTEYVNTPLGDKFDELIEILYEQTDFPEDIEHMVLDAYGSGEKHFIGTYMSTVDEPTEEMAQKVMGAAYPDLMSAIEEILKDFPEFIDGLEIKTVFGMTYS